MASQIDALLTSEERKVLSAYADPKKYGTGRAVRLSVQYALGAGVFVLLCLQEKEPLWVLAVYAIFLIFMAIRLVGARKLAGIMRAIIAKYEARITELEMTGGATHDETAR